MVRPIQIFLVAFTAASAVGSAASEKGEWGYHGGDFANTRYSPLDQINRDNFSEVSVAWRWRSIDWTLQQGRPRLASAMYQATPLVVGGRMYVSTSMGQIAALDPGTGEQIWSFDTGTLASFMDRRPPGLGYMNRGLSYWTEGEEARLFFAAQDHKLWAIDPATGEPCSGFGGEGFVTTRIDVDRPINHHTYTHHSPVGICRDTVIVGSLVGDGVTQKEMTPGFVQGFDARTGQRKWTFHTIPQDGEFGTDTWEEESWRYSGNTNVWAPISSDEALNHVYLAVSTPTNDFYGGHRLGDNLFAESVVCIDGATGERIWHFQTIHHGLWDYDLPAAPTLADVVIDGAPRKILVQVSKQGFAYVLDRITGEPIWPVEERPVPPSTVPGERAASTQPFPTRPRPFERQGFSDDDVIDFTPAIREAALKSLEGYKRGPLYTPPSVEGTLALPSPNGGASWPGAALDPVTAMLYVPSHTHLTLYRVVQPDPNRSNLRYVSDWHGLSIEEIAVTNGLPVVRPPIARVTAIDLKTGDHVWMTPHGDGPLNHPALKGLEVASMGAYGSGRGPLVTKSLLFVSQGRAELGSEADKKPKLSVFDKATGHLLGQINLPGDPFGNPMTYLHRGKQYIAVAIGGDLQITTPLKDRAEIVALSL